MLRTFPQLNITSDTQCTPQGPRNENSFVNNYPNPVSGETIIEFITAGGHTLLQLVGPNGRMISTIHERTYDRPSTIKVKYNLTGMQPGMYYIHYQNGTKTQMKPVIKIN